MLARDARIGDDQIAIHFAAHRVGSVIQRQRLLIAALHEDRDGKMLDIPECDEADMYPELQQHLIVSGPMIGTRRIVTASTRLTMNAKAIKCLPTLPGAPDPASNQQSCKSASTSSIQLQGAAIEGVPSSPSSTDLAPVYCRYSRTACPKWKIQCGKYHSEAAIKMAMVARNEIAHR
jgi:hypothetical protein